jgi:hypothetical protein
MISRTAVYLSVTGILAILVACVSLQSKNGNSPATPADNAAPADSAAEQGGKVQPDTKIITMNLEGESEEVELKLFQHSSLPFTTYYPAKSFTPELRSSEDGVGVRFYFSPTGEKNAAAYICFFLPNRSDNLEDMQELVLGDRGLLVSNQWELLDRTNIVSYSWAEEKMLYRQQAGGEQMVGAIYVGQEAGYTFYTVTHYPIEYGDGFEPRSNILLENLQFQP